MFILIIYLNNASNARSYLPKSFKAFPLLYHVLIYFGYNLMHYSYLIRMFILIVYLNNASNARSYLPKSFKAFPLNPNASISLGFLKKTWLKLKIFL